MARIMEIHGELSKTRQHNEKHRLYDISKFQKMLFFCYIFLKNEETSKFVEI